MSCWSVWTMAISLFLWYLNVCLPGFKPCDVVFWCFEALILVSFDVPPLSFVVFYFYFLESFHFDSSLLSAVEKFCDKFGYPYLVPVPQRKFSTQWNAISEGQWCYKLQRCTTQWVLWEDVIHVTSKGSGKQSQPTGWIIWTSSNSLGCSKYIRLKEQLSKSTVLGIRLIVLDY